MEAFYWLAGFSSEADRFFSFWLFIELMVLFTTFFGQALAVRGRIVE